MENNRVNDIKRGSLKIYNKISKPLARQTENTMNSYMPTNQITKVSWTNSQKHKTAKTRGGEKKKKKI